MVVERMVHGAPGDERGYYDGGYAYSVLSEVKPQSVACYLFPRESHRRGEWRSQVSRDRKIHHVRQVPPLYLQAASAPQSCSSTSLNSCPGSVVINGGGHHPAPDTFLHDKNSSPEQMQR